ncbi:MAG: dihydrodipicolinate synthase family protein [Saprospiraceae bacterium]
MKLSWEGIYPAVTTKFTETDELDLPAFAVNIEAQIMAGVDAIVLGGSLGEASTLDHVEKSVLLKETIRLSNGRVPVLMNIAEQQTKAAVQLAQQYEAEGAAGLMLLPPLKYKADDREVVSYFKTIATETTLPIMIYNNPVDYKIKVTVEMFESLLTCENIQAVKESTRDLTNITRMRNAFGDRIKILCGVDTIALECLVAGADGWVAGLVNAFPRETVVIYKLVKAGRIEEALSIYRWFMPLLELDIHPKLVQNIKLAEVAVGLGTETVRAPRLPLIGTERAQVQEIITRSLASRPDLSAFDNL